MPRFRLPRINLAGWRNPDPESEDEHDSFVFMASVAAFVVVVAGIITFVLIAAANAGEGMAVKQPPIPTITNAAPAPTTTTTTEPAAPPTTTTTTAAPTIGSEVAVIKPKPKPKPKPAPPKPPTRTQTPQPPDPGPPQTADPFDRCAPEGAHAFTKHRHIPLICHDGRWHFEGLGR